MIRLIIHYLESKILGDLIGNGYNLCMANAVNDNLNVATIAMPPTGKSQSSCNNTVLMKRFRSAWLWS
jgi:hypothetical protein